jgi:hypothetical protein
MAWARCWLSSYLANCLAHRGPLAGVPRTHQSLHTPRRKQLKLDNVNHVNFEQQMRLA